MQRSRSDGNVKGQHTYPHELLRWVFFPLHFPQCVTRPYLANRNARTNGLQTKPTHQYQIT